MDAGEDAGALLPELLAVETVGGDVDVLAVEECAEDALAVACGRGGGVAVFPVDVLGGGFHDGVLPELFSGGAVEANEDALPGVGHGRDGEEPAAEDDGRGVAFAGEFGAPHDIVGLAPCRRECGLGAPAVVARAAPHGPVIRDGIGCEDGESEKDASEHCAEVVVSGRTGQACGGCAS